jgi:hypothetical protein
MLFSSLWRADSSTSSVRSQWSCDYHFNVNIQQIYTLGAWEHILPLFDMLESESFQSVMRSNAKNLFGIDDGLLLTHAVDNRGFQCGGISVGAVLDFACGGWVGKLYWDYYRHTLDKEFLRERAFPFIEGLAFGKPGTMAGATAIQEMLVHRKGDSVYVFPGIPEKWQDVSFENIRLPRGICVSAVRNHGRTVSVQIKSLIKSTLKIKLPENISPITVDLVAGEEKNIAGTAG